MHHKLHTPDPIGCGVRAGCGGPWRELFGERADVGPISAASDRDGTS